MSPLPIQAGEEDLFADVRRRYKKKNILLFSHGSACLQELLADMQGLRHPVLVLWAFFCAQEALTRLETSYPADPRPGEAMALCRQWAQGSVKMPQARHAILALHAMAKETDSAVDAALCHALGHACATVHTGKHAIGLPIYELTAMVLERGMAGFELPVLDRVKAYRTRLEQVEHQQPEGLWAAFLTDK